MDSKIAGQWVRELRSGRYQQATGRLRGVPKDGSDGVGFCCLGVLCEMHREFINDQLGETVAYWAAGLDYGYYCGTHQANSVLPENVRRWAGLASVNPSFPDGDGSTYLSNMNDGCYGFDAIADEIEARVEML